MTDFAHRTRQQDDVSEVYGTASALTGEVGIFTLKVQNETQPPVRFHFGCSLLGALVPDRYALLFFLNLNVFIQNKLTTMITDYYMMIIKDFCSSIKR